MAKINITFNGTTYAIDENKLTSSISKLETTLDNLTKIPPSEGLAYTLREDNTSYSVSGIGTCTDTDIVIASEYKGLPVTSIGEAAFYGCTSLTSVVIPDSVTSIGGEAFYQSGLSNQSTGVVYADKWVVDHFGENRASEIIEEGAVGISKYAFFGASVTNIIIPDSIKYINNDAFMSTWNLQSITYTGTINQWNSITFGDTWDRLEVIEGDLYHTLTIHCIDGDIQNR